MFSWTSRKPFLKRKRVLRRISILDLLRRRIYRNLSEHRGDDVIEILIDALNASNYEVRAAAVYGLSFQDDKQSRKALLNQLEKENQYQVRIELLRAIGKRGIQSAEKKVQSFLKKQRTPVQYAAAHVLGRIGTMDSVSVLIKRMEQIKSGRLYHEIAYALSFMTGKTFGGNTDKWKEWRRNNGSNSLVPPSERKLPDDVRNGPAGDENRASTEFYGLPVTSNNIMFVVDASGSMSKEAEYTGVSAGFEPGGSGPDVPALPDEPSRMDVARNQLMKAIKGLKRNQMFNIIFFAGYETIWNENRMVPATPDQKSRAFNFIQKTKLQGATAIFDALELGFDFGIPGKIAIGEHIRLNNQITKMAPDTIYLLSDGGPAWGQYDLREDTGFVYNDLYQRINKMNQFRLLKLYGVSIGRRREFFDKLITQSLYYPDPDQRPDWWIQPGTAVGR